MWPGSPGNPGCPIMPITPLSPCATDEMNNERSHDSPSPLPPHIPWVLAFRQSPEVPLVPSVPAPLCRLEVPTPRVIPVCRRVREVPRNREDREDPVVQARPAPPTPNNRVTLVCRRTQHCAESFQCYFRLNTNKQLATTTRTLTNTKRLAY
jgi:hypothetical protein